VLEKEIKIQRKKMILRQKISLFYMDYIWRAFLVPIVLYYFFSYWFKIYFVHFLVPTFKRGEKNSSKNHKEKRKLLGDHI